MRMLLLPALAWCGPRHTLPASRALQLSLSSGTQVVWCRPSPSLSAQRDATIRDAGCCCDAPGASVLAASRPARRSRLAADAGRDGDDGHGDAAGGGGVPRAPPHASPGPARHRSQPACADPPLLLWTQVPITSDADLSDKLSCPTSKVGCPLCYSMLEQWNVETKLPEHADTYCADVVSDKWRAMYQTLTGRAFVDQREKTRCIAIAAARDTPRPSSLAARLPPAAAARRRVPPACAPRF